MNCSSVQQIYNEFDSSINIKLEQNQEDYNRINGKIKIDKIIFTKKFKDGQESIPRLFCKFEGRNGEYLEGKTIELKLDGMIYELSLDESRLAQYGKITSSPHTLLTRVGAFTFSNSSKDNITILAMETTLSKEILEAILDSKILMLRVFTKNIDGISQNIFRNHEYSSGGALRDIKEFINTVPK